VNKSLAVVLLFLVIAGVALFANSPQAAEDMNPAERVQEWEYEWSGGTREEMKRMGEEGWEAYAVAYDDLYDTKAVWYKRPKVAAKKSGD
jgi:hypothetical protein